MRLANILPGDGGLKKVGLADYFVVSGGG